MSDVRVDTSRDRPMRRVLVMNAGLLIWSAHFGAVYLVASVACGRGLGGVAVGPVGLIPFGTVLVTLLSLAATAPFLVGPLRALGRDGHAVDRFLHATTALGAGIAALAMIFGTLPALILPTCP